MSMKIRAALVILLVIVVVTAANYFSSIIFTTQSIRDIMEEQLNLALDIADTVVVTKIELLKSNAETIAARLHKSGSPEEMTETMSVQLEEFPDFISFTVYDSEGIYATYGAPVYHDVFVDGSEYIRAALGGAKILSSPHKDGGDGSMVMHVFIPIEPDMVLSATIPGMLFTDLLAPYRLWQTGSVFIIDSEGTFVANYRDELVLTQRNFIRDAETDPQMATAAEFYKTMISTMERGSGNYYFEGKERLCVYKYVTNSIVGWRIGVSAPIAEGPSNDVRDSLLLAALVFLAIGAVISVFASNFAAKPLIRLEKLNETVQVQAAHILDERERIKLLLDATPLACRMWSKEHVVFECNEESVKLFGLRDKQEYLDRFYDLSPEYQPDGMLSTDKINFVLEKVFAEGRYVFEWLHNKLDGSLIPCEITLVRLKYGNDYVVAGYTRDLREQQSMIGEIERSISLLSTVNQATGILLRSKMASFTADMQNSMGMLADTVGVDRISIWKNYDADDHMYYYNQVTKWPGEAELLNGGVDFSGDVEETLCYSEIVPSWEEMLSRGESIHSLVKDMPQSEMPQFSMQGIKSVFVTPVLIENQLWGFVGYDNFYEEKRFNENEKMIMNSAGILLASALLRNEMMANLQSANSAKSDFLAKMSHEMRTPLNAIIGLSELALGDDTINEEVRMNIEKVNNAGVTLLSTVNDILDISKIEAGKLELVPVKYDLPSMLNDTVTQSTMHIDDKPISFILDVDENLPVQLFGDDLRIKQILNNLLSNAFKYTNEGSVTLSVRCERESEETSWLVAQVADTGRGIKEEDVDSLFDEFGKFDQLANRNIMGTGLGLPITKKMVELMNGSITVESDYGKGSTFTARLMQGYVTETVIGPEVVKNLKNYRYTDQKRRNKSALKRIKVPYANVLIVDDTVSNLDVAKGLLKPYGMHVDCVSSGQLAIDAIRIEAVRYNAVFMDHMMPGMDGIEATGHIRELGTEYALNVPIIACTANAIVGNDEMFLGKGFQDFLSKPIDIAKLDEIVRKWVADKEQEAQYADSDEESHTDGLSSHARAAFDKLPENIDIDVDGGVERFMGDGEVYLDILRSFVMNTRPLQQKIENAGADGLADYEIVVHGIKGSTRNILASQVGDMAEELEKAAKEGNLGYIGENNSPFAAALDELLNGLESALAEIAEQEQKGKKDKPDMVTLEKLRIACDSFDMGGVNEAISELDSFEYESDDGLAAWLKENAIQLNYSVIAEKLKDLLL